MQVEIYQTETLENSSETLTEMFEDWERRRRLVQELGLAGQQEYMNKLETARNVPFKLIDREEYRIWTRYLPTPYVEDEEILKYPSSGSNRLVQYSFDLIPLPVLEIWQYCRQMSHFESYEIWTNEENSDPILIGRKDDLDFLIARWGESLKPFEEIEREVQHRSRRSERVTTALIPRS